MKQYGQTRVIFKVPNFELILISYDWIGWFCGIPKKFARVKIVVSYVVLKAKFMLSGQLGYQSLNFLELEMWHYFLHFCIIL
jgi:hypothetical protein